MKNLPYVLFALSALLAVILSPVIGFLAALCFVILTATILNKPRGRLCVTLSVPEILMDTMEAFKAELPNLMQVGTNFSKSTAVKGDKITGHISLLPSVQPYDATNGFNNSPASAANLIADCSVTLNTLYHVPVQLKWLDQLSAKKPLYKEAIRNIAFVMAKKVVDDLLALVTPTNFTNSFVMNPVTISVDAFEALRTTCNQQKILSRGRFGVLNGTAAVALQDDDRVKSSLFYAQLNGDRGYRRFDNLCGIEQCWEYPDLPTSNNLIGFVGDPRSLVFAARTISFSDAAEKLGVPQIMAFFPMADPDIELPLTGVTWQQPGTGDVYVSCALLYGVAAGAGVGAGTPGSGTDNAGIRIVSA